MTFAHPLLLSLLLLLDPLPLLALLVLFLLPLPWWGPVLAPALIAALDDAFDVQRHGVVHLLAE